MPGAGCFPTTFTDNSCNRRPNCRGGRRIARMHEQKKKKKENNKKERKEARKRSRRSGRRTRRVEPRFRGSRAIANKSVFTRHCTANASPVISISHLGFKRASQGVREGERDTRNEETRHLCQQKLERKSWPKEPRAKEGATVIRTASKNCAVHLARGG